MRSFPILILSVFLLAGCANFYCSRYPNCNYAPTVAANIPIYNNFPPTPYEVIGEVGGNGAPASSWSGMGKRMREYAAQIGGDAIVLQSQETPYTGTYNTPATAATTSTAYGSAYGSGNYVYGQAYGESQTVYNPGVNIPMYGKSVRAVVIKFPGSGHADEQVVTSEREGYDLKLDSQTDEDACPEGFSGGFESSKYSMKTGYQYFYDKEGKCLGKKKR